MRFKFAIQAAALALAATPAAAEASTIVWSQCLSVTSSQGCLFKGNINGNTNPFNQNSYVNAELNYNLYNDFQPFARPNIDLNYLFDTSTTADLITGGNGSSGTWSTPGYLIDFIAVKAGDYFVLYQIDPASSGTWDTFDIPTGNDNWVFDDKGGKHGWPPQPKWKDLSHIVFFGSQANAVPEPAAWGMMIGGFGLAGMAMRRRRSRGAPKLA